VLAARHLGSALMHGRTLREILQRCAEALAQHLDASLARIWIDNQRAGALELQAIAGIYIHIDGPYGQLPFEKFNMGLIAEQRKPHFTNSVIGDPRFSEREWDRPEGLMAFAGYPLIIGDRAVGVMAMFARDTLSPATLNQMVSIADMLALGIERKRLDKELRSALGPNQRGAVCPV
jgi:GAF domain-containing protein